MEAINKISLDLIDDPKVAMRSVLDGPKMDELMASIKENGLIEPVVLRPVGGRYEIIAGHRRTRACRLLGMPNIEAKLIEADEDKTLALRLAENTDRADVNPVDEACFIGEIMLRYNKTEEDISNIMKRSPEWVNTRITVFEMPDYIQEHVRNEKISLGAALWLNRIDNEDTRRYYSNWAALNGISVAGAKQWYLNLKASNFNVSVKDVVLTDAGGSVQIVRKVIKCDRCGKDSYLDESDNVWVHRFNCLNYDPPPPH